MSRKLQNSDSESCRIQNPRNFFPPESIKVENDLNSLHIIPPINTLTYENKNVIGIDFGTSRCCAAVYHLNNKSETAGVKDKIVAVSLDPIGERFLPVYVTYYKERVKYGKIAVNRYFSQSTVYDVKQIIGRNFNDIEIDENWPFDIIDENQKVYVEIEAFDGQKRITPEKVAAELLKHVKQKAEEFQGIRVNKAVITVPTVFTEKQKYATIAAATFAGWDEVVLLPEEIAATFAYFIDQTQMIKILEEEISMFFCLIISKIY